MAKAFISQPMRGLTTEEIRENRQKAVKFLRDCGYEVIDSIFTDFSDVQEARKPAIFLCKALELIAREADVVYFMAGYETARGCMLEHRFCEAYDIPKLYEV